MSGPPQKSPGLSAPGSTNVSSAAQCGRDHGARQFEFSLPPQPANDVLEEELRELVTEANETTDPHELAALKMRIRRLRDLLGEGRER